MQNEKRLRELSDSIKHNNICVIGISREEERKGQKWYDLFKVLRGKNLHPRILCPARLSFRVEGDIKSFSDKN